MPGSGEEGWNKCCHSGKQEGGGHQELLSGTEDGLGYEQSGKGRALEADMSGEHCQTVQNVHGGSDHHAKHHCDSEVGCPIKSKALLDPRQDRNGRPLHGVSFKRLDFLETEEKEVEIAGVDYQVREPARPQSRAEETGEIPGPAGSEHEAMVDENQEQGHCHHNLKHPHGFQIPLLE